MNKAIFPSDNDNSIINQLYLLNCGAMKKDMFFNEDNYKWCLGVGVISEIDVTQNIINHSQDEKRTAFGIVVEVDYQNPYKMELWKNITNDI